MMGFTGNSLPVSSPPRGPAAAGSIFWQCHALPLPEVNHGIHKQRSAARSACAGRFCVAADGWCSVLHLAITDGRGLAATGTPAVGRDPQRRHAGAVERARWPRRGVDAVVHRSEEHKSELQSLMRISYAVVVLKKK